MRSMLRRLACSLALLVPLAALGQAQSLTGDLINQMPANAAAKASEDPSAASPSLPILPSIIDDNRETARQPQSGAATNNSRSNGNNTSATTTTTTTTTNTLRRGSKVELNEFQRFVEATAGKILPRFGQELFDNPPSTFAPAAGAPPIESYVIGPGDELVIRAWGQVDIDVHGTVDRNGLLNIPKVGAIPVAGVTYAALPGVVRGAISRLYKSFELSVTLGQLRGIQVMVLGRASSPGTYTLGATSTLVNALFAIGGPASTGSMRHIQLKRHNELVTELDLYALLAQGDLSKDVPLRQGDVIFIPPTGPQVAVIGSINTEAVFELAGASDSLAHVLDLAGGLSTVAKGQQVSVERIENHQTRRVVEFNLDDAGLKRPLRDGDLVNVFAITPRFDQVVTLRGYVAQPGRFAWHEGMRVRDVIPEREALLSREYWQQRNRLVPQLTELQRQDLSPTASRVGEHAPTDVKRPEEIAWDYAVIERLQPDLTTTLVPFRLGKAILEGDEKDNVLLKPGDNIVVFSQGDLRVSTSHQARFVRLEGEFVNPGIYPVQPGETLRDLVARAGGLTSQAYLYGAALTRDSVRETQQKQLDEAVARMQQESRSAAAARARNATATPQDAVAQQAQNAAQQQLIEQFRAIKATGRIVLELPPDHAQARDLPDIAMEDGDRLLVPPTPSVVSVFGSVYNQNSFVFQPQKSAKEYLAQAGGVTRDADGDRVYILQADGSVISHSDAGWLSGSVESRVLRPGDAVIVPEAFDRTTLTKTLIDSSQIFYQFALGVAGLKVLGL